MTDLVQHWIDGTRTSGASVRTGDVFQPATGAVARQVALAEQSDVDLAVASAVRAAHDWAESSLATRSRIMWPRQSGVDLGFPTHG
ncbi:MAG: aldehyde dehydrogenase family protein [Kibdelosporangium sp.]